MTGKKLRLVLFIALAVVQLVVAAGAIIRSEWALRSGETFLFKLQPVDPVDVFRGRYVALRFAIDRTAVAEDMPRLTRKRVFVSLVEDDDGFAAFGPASLSRPKEGAYLRLRSGVDFTDEEGNRQLWLAPPFQRYYMTEELAKGVDRSIWRRGPRPAWVSVKVLSGSAVVEELFIDGQPVREWLASGGPERPPISPVDALTP